MNEQRSGYSRSYLFTVRLWSEDMGSAGVEIRGEVRHVLGSSVRYFQEWTTLTAYLVDKVHELEQERQGARTCTSLDDLTGDPA